MKKLIYLTIFIFISVYAFGQREMGGTVESGKTKNTLAGKNKLLTVPTNKMMLNSFGITLNCYSFEEDEGGNAQVGVRATLTEIDEPLAQEIANEAYAYFVDQWKKRGVEVYSPTKAEIEATKKYSKAASKDKAKIISGGAFRDQDKKKNIIYAWPENTNVASSGSGPMAITGNSAHVVPDYKGDFFYTSFGSTIDFISFKTAKLGTTASVKAFPQLRASNSLSAIVWQKTKFGSYAGNNGMDGIEDFYTERKDNEIGQNIGAAFGGTNTSLNMWDYVGDKAKYKANVMEMIKKGMDDLFADYDAVVAKEQS